MNEIENRLWYSSLLFGLLLIVSTSCQTPKQTEIEHVIVIGIDGMSVGGVEKANTPGFDAIKKEGSYTFLARNIFPTVSSPNWSTMLTSATSSMTGVTTNDWRHDQFNLPPMRTTENGWYPDIFYALKKSGKPMKTASVYQWHGFGNLYDKSNVDLDMPCKNEDQTTSQAIEVIKNEQPNFLFIHLDHVDHWGHAAGHMTDRYLQAVEKADSLSNEIIQAVKHAGLLEKTLIIITADHGGKGHGHGHETVEGNTVPYFFLGANVKKGYELKETMTHLNQAPLITYALNVTPPEVWIGKAPVSLFEGNDEPKNLVGSFQAPASWVPVIEPGAENVPMGELIINDKPEITLSDFDTTGTIYYTLDGSLPSSASLKYTDPFTLEKSTVVKALYQGANGRKSTVAEAYFRILPSNKGQKSVSYKLYQGKGWSKLPDFNLFKEKSHGQIHEFSINELNEQIADNTGIIFKAFFQAKEEGDYRFFASSDDGSKLFVDQQLVVNNDGDHDVQERSGKLHLAPGKHEIKVFYFNASGGAALTVFVEGPGLPKQIISPEFLTIQNKK